MRPEKAKFRERYARDYLNLGRTLWENHYRTEKKKQHEKPRLNQFKDFLTKIVWGWIYYYAINRFGPKAKYQQYIAPETGVFHLLPDGETSDAVTIAIAGDWATYTAESLEIAQRIALQNPAYTIHIGDTYFVGAPHEIYNNFLRKDAPWHKGYRGSFALLGNHEMYARGISFFRDLLPALGIKNYAGDYSGQQAGYFCLESPYWRILGLDTGYNSISLPGLELSGWFAPDCKLPDDLIKWLKTTVNLKDKKSLLILTHHQYISAFHEPEFIRPAEQLAEILGTEREVVWLWGHEHKFSMYKKAQVKKGITAYGRCIGNGGTPIEINAKNFQKNENNNGYPYLETYDKRFRKELDNEPLGYNGFALLKLEGKQLTISYQDNSHELLNETWNANTSGNLEKVVNSMAEGLS